MDDSNTLRREMNRIEKEKERWSERNGKKRGQFGHTVLSYWTLPSILHCKGQRGR